MKRELFGMEISQDSKRGYFSATDLQRAGNLWRLQNGMDQFSINTFFNMKSTKEFIARIEHETGETARIASRGRGKHTWIHPYLFIDMALSISPKLKIEVYSWIMDELVKYRNSSGDSYKKMTGALYDNFGNKREFPFFIKDVARKIKTACHVDDWEHSTEEQLVLRDKIHDNISLLCDVLRDNEKAVNIAILKAISNE